jgi:phosphonate C-P lyase system protein PhnG
MAHNNKPKETGDHSSPEHSVFCRKKNIKPQLYEVLSKMPLAEITSLLDRLWTLGSFTIKKAPEKGMVMYKVRDPFDTQFHLGEILVSESEVELNGYTGWGMIIGDEPERSLLLASTEAAELSGNHKMVELVSSTIDKVKRRNMNTAELMSKLAASTKVQFESMKKETIDFGSLG